MGLPAKRRTKSSKKRRAAHFALKPVLLSLCSHCKKPIPPHRICPFCGYYKGREVIPIKIKKGKRQKETKQKTEKEK